MFLTAIVRPVTRTPSSDDRYLNSANTFLLPSYWTTNGRVAWQWQHYTVALAAENIFDVKYFEYAVASAFVIGRYNAYPLPGRTFLAKAGVTW